MVRAAKLAAPRPAAPTRIAGAYGFLMGERGRRVADQRLGAARPELPRLLLCRAVGDFEGDRPE